MLKKVYFENFKSFKQAELNIGTITPLIGTNASGKTNVIEGMTVLSEIMSGIDLSVILDGTKNGYINIRGGAEGCCRFDSDYFTLGCTVGYNDSIDLEYRIKITVDGRIMVLDESLCEIYYSSNGDIYKKTWFHTKDTDKYSGNIYVSCNNGLKGRNPDVMCIRSGAVITQLGSKLPLDKKYGQTIVNYANCVMETMRNILFLNPETPAMRDYAVINDKILKVNAANISSVLYALCDDKANKSRLMDIMKALPENEITDIKFIKGPLSDVMVALNERVGDDKKLIEAKRLSDGTLRCLSIVAAIMSIEQGGVLVVEEIDNGIHPGRSIKMINLLAQAARERAVRVIFTTHNAVLLNALNKEEIAGVQVAYRDREHGDGKIIPFVEINRVPELLANGNLGDVFSNGKILDYIKMQPKEKANYVWLESF